MTSQAHLDKKADLAERASQGSLSNQLRATAELARLAAGQLALASAEQRNEALLAAAAAIERDTDAIGKANAMDMRQGEQDGLSAPLLDRLQLNDERIGRMVEGLREIAAQPDPLGALSNQRRGPSNIEVAQMAVPIGVIAIVYESRPNVTADAAALCLKSGNVCILHGGREARHSNSAIMACMVQGLKDAGLPPTAVMPLLADSEAPRTERHRAVEILLGSEGAVDLAIPRGGKSLATAVANCARVPVLKHLEGICHLYLHADADLDMAERLSYNSKCYRYSVCCATETVLIDAALGERLLPQLAAGFAERGVELRGCADSRRLVPDMVAASEDDWHAEYLAPVLAVRLVSGLDAAMRHIAQYGSAHTDAIVTDNAQAAQRFLREVDSSSVLHNAPTVFADGKEYGLGAEIGISTDRLHARGPIGAEALTSRKFVVTGQGQERL